MKFSQNLLLQRDIAIHDKLLEALLITCTGTTDIEVLQHDTDGATIAFKDSEGKYRQLFINDYDPTSTSKDYLRKLVKEFLHAVDRL